MRKRTIYIVTATLFAIAAIVLMLFFTVFSGSLERIISIVVRLMP